MLAVAGLQVGHGLVVDDGRERMIGGAPEDGQRLENTTTGLVPSARQAASRASVALRFARMPRSKSASHYSPLTAAAR